MRNALSYSQILAIRTEHVLHIMLGRVVTWRWSSLMGMVVYFMAGMGSCVCSMYRRNEQSNLLSCVSRRDIHSNFHRYICRGGVKNSKFFSCQCS